MKIHSAHYQRLTIDKQQFLRNIELLKQTATQPLHVVVKGNAYGHDLLTASSLFVEAGIERLITYHLSDALMLRKKYPDLSLLLIGPIELGDIAVCRAQNIEITVWDLPFLTTIRKVVQTQSSEWPSLRIHIEIETGMYRTGIVPADIFSLENEVFESVHYEIAGFCTHLSGADEPENIGRVQEQIEIFSSFRNEMMRRIQREFEWHGPNSAALALDTTQVFTHCRVGLLAYGFFPLPTHGNYGLPLQRSPNPVSNGIQMSQESTEFLQTSLPATEKRIKPFRPLPLSWYRRATETDSPVPCRIGGRSRFNLSTSGL
jgi:alanine racemase